VYLNFTDQTQAMSFQVKFEDGFYAVYATSGSIECFKCGDVSHRQSSSPHKEQAVSSGAGEQQPMGCSTAELQAPGGSADELQITCDSRGELLAIDDVVTSSWLR